MIIKITRNCARYENTFISALTQTDGHKHIKENFSNEPKVTTEPLLDAGTSPANTKQTKERKKKSKTKEHNGLDATKEIS